MPDVSSKSQILIRFKYSHDGFDCHTSEVHWSLLLVVDDMVRGCYTGLCNPQNRCSYTILCLD